MVSFCQFVEDCVGVMKRVTLFLFSFLTGGVFCCGQPSDGLAPKVGSQPIVPQVPEMLSRQRENEKFASIVNKLLEQGCYVIDSPLFSEHFTCINKNPNTGKLYYSDWQEATMEDGKYNDKIAIITGGKMTPLVTTEHDYLYCGQATYSWAVPKLSGFFALALQIEPNLTYDEFVDLSIDTAIEKDGIKIFNMEGIVNKLNNKKIK